MKVITVARKPLAGTVAKTALKYGTAGLNIDRSRLGSTDDLNGGAYAPNGAPRPNPEEWRFKREGGAGKYQQPSGRWPANLILEHKPGCQKLGTKVVEGHVIRRYEGDKANRAYGFYIVDEDNRGDEQRATEPEQMPDEVVDVYECVSDCPCVLLDADTKGIEGASRFFKQVGGEPILPD